MCITGSLSFWLTLYDSRLIFHRQPMVILLAKSWPLYQPIVGQYVDRHSVDTAADISADMSADISRSTYRPSVGGYVDRHISWVSVDISSDTSVDYRSICQPIYIYLSRGAQNTCDPFTLIPGPIALDHTSYAMWLPTHIRDMKCLPGPGLRKCWVIHISLQTLFQAFQLTRHASKITRAWQN